MRQEFKEQYKGMPEFVEKYYRKFNSLEEELISSRRNNQGRTIRQIVGHMVDSASNNTHRIVHLQYRESPLDFPNYATHGNNDRWINIQNYQDENWEILVGLWKYTHLHLLHVIENIDKEKLSCMWISGEGERVTLEEMVLDFPRHFKLHLDEIEALLKMG